MGCYVLVGDQNGHIGLGAKAAKEVATAIRGGIIAAKRALLPVRRGYWGNKIGLPHTMPMKVAGKSGSVRVRLVPALCEAALPGVHGFPKSVEGGRLLSCVAACPCAALCRV